MAIVYQKHEVLNMGLNPSDDYMGNSPSDDFTANSLKAVFLRVIHRNDGFAGCYQYQILQVVISIKFYR